MQLQLKEIHYMPRYAKFRTIGNCTTESFRFVFHAPKGKGIYTVYTVHSEGKRVLKSLIEEGKLKRVEQPHPGSKYKNIVLHIK